MRTFQTENVAMNQRYQLLPTPTPAHFINFVLLSKNY